MTTTEAPSTIYETVTTHFESISEYTVTTTVEVTETASETAATETLYYTETATFTGPVQTDTLTETATDIVTETSTETAPAITITSTIVPTLVPTTLKKRTVGAMFTSLPEYASADCPDWNKYTKACKCAGAEMMTTITSTISAAVETVTTTVSIPDEVITVTNPATATSTVTAVVSLTATDASTAVETVTETPDSVTATETVTETSTTTAVVTETPTTVVTKNPSFQATVALSGNLAGQTGWLWAAGSTTWWIINGGVGDLSASSYPTSVWNLDNDGYLSSPNGDHEAYILTSDTAGAVRSDGKATVDAGVAAGTMRRISASISNDLKLTMVVGDRSTIWACPQVFYITSGNAPSGSGLTCYQASPVIRYT